MKQAWALCLGGVLGVWASLTFSPLYCGGKSNDKENVSAKQQQPATPALPLVNPLIKSDGTQNDTSDDCNQPESWWQRVVRDPIALFTGLILVVYVGLFWLGRKQTRAVVRAADASTLSANTAKLALEVLERADVLLARVSLTIGSAGDIRITPNSECILTVRNYGRTRAESMAIHAMLDITTEFGDTSFGSSEAQEMPLILGSGEESSLKFQSLWREVGADLLFGVRDGTYHLRVSADIAFADVFGGWHTIISNADFDATTGEFWIRHMMPTHTPDDGRSTAERWRSWAQKFRNNSEG